MASSEKPHVSRLSSFEKRSRKNSAKGRMSPGHSAREGAYLELAEAVVEVFPKFSFFNRPFHVLVRGGYDSHACNLFFGCL